MQAMDEPEREETNHFFFFKLDIISIIKLKIFVNYCEDFYLRTKESVSDKREFKFLSSSFNEEETKTKSDKYLMILYKGKYLISNLTNNNKEFIDTLIFISSLIPVIKDLEVQGSNDLVLQY